MPLQLSTSDPQAVEITISDTNDIEIKVVDSEGVDLITIAAITPKVIRVTSLGGPLPNKSCFELKQSTN